MATKEDALVIDGFQRLIERCRAEHIDPEKLMCQDVGLYYKAVHAVRNSGIWAVDLGVVGLIINLIMNSWHPLILIVGIIVILLSGHSGN